MLKPKDLSEFVDTFLLQSISDRAENDRILPIFFRK